MDKEPVDNDDKRIARALYHLADSFDNSDIGLNRSRLFEDRQITELHRSCQILIDSERTPGKGKSVDAQSNSWFTDEELLTQIGEDSQKADALRTIVAHVEALIPDVFRPDTDRKKVAAVARAFGAMAEKQQLQEITQYHAFITSKNWKEAFEKNKNREYLNLRSLLESKSTYAYKLIHINEIKEVVESRFPGFFAETHLSHVDEAEKRRIKQAVEAAWAVPGIAA